MRIAMVSPLYESVPPKLYGGTERVVSYLTEELVRQGHDVTLFASGDSKTQAKLISPCSEALRLSSRCKDPLAHHVLMVEEVFKRAPSFDVIHFNIDYIHYPLFRRCPTPNVTTLHGRLDIEDQKILYREFKDMPVVSISYAQRKPLPWLNWAGNVYHGLPEDLYEFHPEPGKYLAFLGRISPEKRPDRAIQIAERAGMKLLMAAKVDKADKDYFEEVVRPMLKSSWVEFIGEIGEKEKSEFLGKSFALLFLIDWPEPFGLVMIEAMACGTPVVAWKNGSVPEIIDPGVTGFIVGNMDEAVAAVEKVESINRLSCRRTFEERFTASRMAQDYLKVYSRLVEKEKPLLKAV